MFYINNVVAWQALSLLTAAVIPAAILYSGNESNLLLYNSLMIAIALSIFFDSTSLLRLERVFSKVGGSTRYKLITAIIFKHLLIVTFILMVGAVEYCITGFSFLIIAYVRHLQNILRVVFVHFEALGYLKYSVNMLAAVRNIAIIWVAIIGLDVEAFGFALFLLSTLEIFFSLSLVLRKVAISLRQKPTIRFDFRLGRVRRMLSFSQSQLTLSNAVLGITERSLVSLILPSNVQVEYLTLKVIVQYIDAAYAAIAYRVRVFIFSNEEFVTLNNMIAPFFIVMSACFVSAWYFSATSLELTVVAILLIGLLANIRRWVDVFLAPMAMVHGYYGSIVKRNLVEIAIVAGLMVVFSELLDGESLFIFILSVGVSPSIFLGIFVLSKFHSKLRYY